MVLCGGVSYILFEGGQLDVLSSLVLLGDLDGALIDDVEPGAALPLLDDASSLIEHLHSHGLRDLTHSR